MPTSVYAAGFINKPLRAHNRSFAKKLAKSLRKILKTSKNNVKSQELNTFLILSAVMDNGYSLDDSELSSIESEAIFNHFFGYYEKNIRAHYQSKFRSDRELKETSSIVRAFLRSLDPILVKEFNIRLGKLQHELPTAFCEVGSKSLVSLWENQETQFYRFSMAGIDQPFIISMKECGSLDILSLLDKFLILNFFLTFLSPSMMRLQQMNRVLEKLELIIDPEAHIRSPDPKIQKQFDLFKRILLAKLNALSELEQLYYRTFNLFEVPNIIFSQLDLYSMNFLRLNDILDDLAEQVSGGKSILHDVANRITHCQKCLQDYLTDGGTAVDSMERFRTYLHPLAELSIDLFVEAESLKIWADFFGRDIPFFSFDTLGTKEEEKYDIPDDTILAVRRLFKNYSLGTTTVYAVRGVSLDVKEGEFLVITGSSGAGKTTLLNCMASLDTPDYGTVIFRGQQLSEMSDNEKARARLNEMGFIFQSYALLPHYTTRENVALPAELANLDNEMRDRVDELLAGVGIDLQASQYPAQLSGGQLQRVAIARALTNNPSIIFADEPTGDLDSVTGKQVMDLLKKFHEETGTTIVVITHDPEVAAYAQRELKMQDGVIK
ncbi:MAG: ABC transporter ATP-binding protein [Candidatus Heimdallarchaeota archaeon]